MIGPAAMIAVRRDTGLWANERSFSSADSSASSPASPAPSPSICTYPPRGMAQIIYSVSPHWRETTRGPKPRENFRTLTPANLAMQK